MDEVFVNDFVFGLFSRAPKLGGSPPPDVELITANPSSLDILTPRSKNIALYYLTIASLSNENISKSRALTNFYKRIKLARALASTRSVEIWDNVINTVDRFSGAKVGTITPQSGIRITVGYGGVTKNYRMTREMLTSTFKDTIDGRLLGRSGASIFEGYVPVRLDYQIIVDLFSFYKLYLLTGKAGDDAISVNLEMVDSDTKFVGGDLDGDSRNIFSLGKISILSIATGKYADLSTKYIDIIGYLMGGAVNYKFDATAALAAVAMESTLSSPIASPEKKNVASSPIAVPEKKNTPASIASPMEDVFTLSPEEPVRIMDPPKTEKKLKLIWKQPLKKDPV